ncbi:MAG: LPS export ABC transporter periplasmic protein LptC [Mariprofundaceae bacterium]
MKNREWALLKWSCLAVSIGSVVVAAGLLWTSSKSVLIEEPQQVTGEAATQPQAKIEKPLIVERKGEKIIWRLQADSAKQQEKGMYLVEPRLELFTDSGEAVPVKGREAWFEPIRKNIRFKGGVEIRYREWTLHSEELHYDSERDEMVVPGSFKAAKPDFTLRGRGLRVDRKTQQLTVDHDVRVKDATSRALGDQS